MTKKKYLSLEQMFASGSKSSERVNDLFSANKVAGAASHLCIYENSDVLNLPSIVVPADDDLESFFADVATYFPERVPISAYVYVLDSATLSRLQADRGGDLEVRSDRAKLVAFMGLILGEALSMMRLAGSQVALAGYATCKRTLTYCFARTALLHPHLQSNEIASRWLSVRERTGMESSVKAAAAATWAVDLINGKGLLAGEPSIGAFLKTLSSYLTKKTEREVLIRHFTGLYPGLASCVPLFYEVYDKRINAFDAVVETIRNGSRGQNLDSICVAFFANLILPGSMAHTGLMDRQINTMPDALLWYGLFAGSSGEFSWTSAVGSVGQKLIRDLIAPFDAANRPACDVSIEEYEVLSRLPLRPETLKPSQGRAVLLSMYPGVDIYVRSVMEEDDAAERNSVSRILAERDDQINEVRHLLRQAEQLLSGDLGSRSYGRTSAKPTKKLRQSRGS